MEPPRWKIITPSQQEWERRGLDFIRSGLPNHDPYLAWANFEFQAADGAIYEVQLLVLTKQGFWLVEIKDWPGRVGGDAGTWTRTKDGQTCSEDNPVLLAERKAKALLTLLKSQQAVKKVQVPSLDAIVFLSADNLQCDLIGPARNRVLLQDRAGDDERPERKGSHAVCQSIRRILATDENDPAWSRRAWQRFVELRDEHPWVSADSTTLVQQPNGQIRWWTFAGGIANTLLADSLKPHCEVKADNLSLTFPTATSLDAVAERIGGLRPEDVHPIPNPDAMENLKFSECLPPGIAAEVFTSRFDDPPGVGQALRERRRVVVQNCIEEQRGETSHGLLDLRHQP